MTSTRDLIERNSISIYPNPAQNQITFNWNRPEAINNVTLAIYDISGKEVVRKTINVFPNQKIQIPLKGISSGIYQVILQTEIGIIAEKLIIQ